MYQDFHDRDAATPPICSTEEYCRGRDQEKKSWVPFLSFPISKLCNFKCIYCGIGGEATASEVGSMELPLIQRLVPLAISHGIIKFRITGGEPFLHRRIGDILTYFSDLGYYTLVNTNGSMLMRRAEVLSTLSQNLRFAISLDTLKAGRLPAISEKGSLVDILQGIEFAKSLGLLLRLNMVVGSHNYDEVYDIIEFCGGLGCDLKLLDIVSVPVPFGSRDTMYHEITSLEERLADECDEIMSHEYSRGFGTPCFRYRFGKTVVTVKNSYKGSHYDRQRDEGICVGCPYFPCHEGLYDIFALSDGRLCACRWSEQQHFPDAERQLQFLVDSFRESRFVAVNSAAGMSPRTDLGAA